EIVEQYVLDKLSADDRRIFQEHFFACDHCFQQAQDLSATLARVRHAAARGALDSNEPQKAAAAFSWLRPMFAFSIVACILLGGVLVALFLVNGHLHAELAEQEEALRSQSRAQTEIENAKRDVEQKLQAAGADRARLQEQLDELNRSKRSPRPDENLLAQANIPSVTLESSRDANSAAELAIPANASRARLLLLVEISDRFESFSVEIQAKSKASVTSIGGLRPGQSGMLSVTVRAARLDAGDYRVKLYAKTVTGRELLAEYDLRVVKK
ncbi:MAG TPA: hypothetical protein VHP99_15455, partial [Pyrinomonadaceae bacterium]|nr:hypothetical protein [Pyrinomonadaceae bacterium]